MKKEKMKMEQTEVVKTETKGLTTAPMDAAWGTEDLDSADIKIPRMLLMQQMSDFVMKKKASSGDYVDNITGQKLGDETTPVELILIDSFKNWIISEKAPKASKFEFSKVVSWKDGNPAWGFDEALKDGTLVRRYKCLNFYVLPVNAIDGMPYLLTYRSAGFKHGQKVVTFATQAKMLSKPMAWKTWKLSCMTETNDFGTYYVPIGEPGRLTTEQELAKAYSWYKIIRNQKVAVAEDTELDGTAVDTEDRF